MFVTTKDLVMNLHSDNYYVYGINAMNASTDRRDENSELIEGAQETVKLVINAENTIINATTGTDIDPQYKEHRAIGIVAFSEAEEALQKNLFPSRIEQNCSVRFFFTTSKNGVFFCHQNSIILLC